MDLDVSELQVAQPEGPRVEVGSSWLTIRTSPAVAVLEGLLNWIV